MAQCKDCYNDPDCEYCKHPSNSHITKEEHHNCQEFNGVVAGYRIHRTGGKYPEGQVIIHPIKD